MNKAEAQKELGIANPTAFYRVDKRMVAQGLLTPEYVVGAKNGKRERTYSQADIELMRKHRNGSNSERSAVSEEKQIDSHSILIRNNPINGNQPAIQLFTQAVTETLRTALADLKPPDRILVLKELPISRGSALNAQKSGKLRMFKNHPHLGRGWRCLESDFQKFLREIE